MSEQTKTKQDLKHKIFTIVGIVLCVILLPMLIVNVIMIVNSYANKDEAPSVGKYIPFIVQSGSMSGVIEGGDIIITTKIEPEDVKLDDIITFYDPKGNGTSVVTHRVIEIETKDGKLVFTTVGDVVMNENIEKYGTKEEIPEEVMKSIVEVVPEEKVISKYSFRIPVLGHVSLFMSTIPGFIVCVLVPLLLLVGYDVVRRKINDKANEQDTAALLAELEQLRAAKNAGEKKQEEQRQNDPEVEEETSTDTNQE
jgi:signal peptidase